MGSAKKTGEKTMSESLVEIVAMNHANGGSAIGYLDGTPVTWDGLGFPDPEKLEDWGKARDSGWQGFISDENEKWDTQDGEWVLDEDY